MLQDVARPDLRRQRAVDPDRLRRERRAQRTPREGQARAKLQEAERKLKVGIAAAQQMDDWQKRSLPSNYEKALSLYKAWLLAKAKDAGLSVTDITVG